MVESEPNNPKDDMFGTFEDGDRDTFYILKQLVSCL